MARIQKHHITYKPVEWLLELNMLQHRTISRIQSTKATPMAYADLTNFVHALLFEWNRMRMEMETGVDLRVIDFTKGKPVKKPFKPPKIDILDIVKSIKWHCEEGPFCDDPEALILSIQTMITKLQSGKFTRERKRENRRNRR